MNPEWARLRYIQLLENDELGLSNPDLKTLKRLFSAIIINPLIKKHKVFTTLGSRLDSNTSSGNKRYEYPCLINPTHRHH